MAYNENEARELVIEAGKRLLETGLIARTWGNVSARISDTQFVITPSGKPYDTLKPEELVIVNIADCSYDGDIKPSSEKGIHADAYKHRRNVNFIIHTHQVRASVVGATGKPVTNVPEKYREILGTHIPVADYGMPSTGKLRKALEQVYINFTESKAFLMEHHGVVCLGNDYDEAFLIAETLETLCKDVIHRAYRVFEGTASYSRKSMIETFIRANGVGQFPKVVTDFGESERNSDGKTFTIKYRNGNEFIVDIKSCTSDSEKELPRTAMVHAEIYRNTDVSFLKHCTEINVIGYSVLGAPIRPRLDDFAQIAGVRIKCVPWNGSQNCARQIAIASRGKNVILIKGLGAILTGKKKSDLEAVELVLSKECQTQFGATFFGAGDPLSAVDCNIMRTIYVTKYSKKAE